MGAARSSKLEKLFLEIGRSSFFRESDDKERGTKEQEAQTSAASHFRLEFTETASMLTFHSTRETAINPDFLSVPSVHIDSREVT